MQEIFQGIALFNKVLKRRSSGLWRIIWKNVRKLLLSENWVTSLLLCTILASCKPRVSCQKFISWKRRLLGKKPARHLPLCWDLHRWQSPFLLAKHLNYRVCNYVKSKHRTNRYDLKYCGGLLSHKGLNDNWNVNDQARLSSLSELPVKKTPVHTLKKSLSSWKKKSSNVT